MATQNNWLVERLRPIQQSFEKKVVAYVQSHVLEVEIFLFCFFVMFFVSKVPYLNIFITKQVSTLFLIIFSIYLFQLKKSFMLIGVVVLFIVAMIMTLVGKLETAEETGVLIYTLLWIIAILHIRDLWRQR